MCIRDRYLTKFSGSQNNFTFLISHDEVALTFTGLLDDYPGAAAAYSLRLLDKDYTGDAIRVRRASDNTEQDIGFDSNDELDTAALATFCSGTDGFVKTWYDQSGNGNDATQTTTGNQPKIYDASTGVIEEGSAGNEKPAIQFDGSDDYLQSGAISALDTDVQSSFVVFRDTSGDTALRIAWRSSYTSGASLYSSELTGLYKATVFGFHARTSAGSYRTATNSQDTNQNLISTLWNASNVVSARLNGVDFTTNNLTTATASPSGHNYIRIGATSATSPSSYWQGTIQAFIIYPSDQDDAGNQSGIETNINDYYSIY